MTTAELERELGTERELNERILEEKAEILDTLEAMAESARCLAESFRMTLEAHHLCKDGHRKVFSRYSKAKKLYDALRDGTTIGSSMPESR